jgi:hypothetical protein
MSKLGLYVMLVLTVFVVGAALIVAGSVNLTLQMAAWPFAWVQDASTRLIRDLNPHRSTAQ